MIRPRASAERRLFSSSICAAAGLLHRRGVELKAVSTALLRLVHRIVGAAEERRDVVGVLRERRDADARRDEHLGAPDQDARRELVGDAPRDRDRVLGPAKLGEHDDELVASEPGRDRGAIAVRLAGGVSSALGPPRGDGVAGANRARDALGDLAQELVAARVAERVVHALEAIEIEDEDRGALVVSARGGDRVLEEPIQERAIR